MKLCVATQNQGKLKEFTVLARQFFPALEFCSVLDFKTQLGAVPEVEETGLSFIDNAKIKAKAYAQWTDLPCLSDDSGLVVPALGGEPGLYSARYAGEGASDEENNQKLLFEMKQKDLLHPKAQFVCALAVYFPGSDTFLCSEGILQGHMIHEQTGEQGFGYNPLFYVEEKHKTLAQMSIEEKLSLDHRSLAFQKLVPQLGGL